MRGSLKTTARTQGSAFLILVMCIAVASCSRIPSARAAHKDWSPTAAARYLDQRADWWMSWSSATRDHGTFCISCHTALPYVLSRSALGGVLGEKALVPSQRRILENVIKRVRLWNETQPYYGDQADANLALQSRGTESVLNALILVSFDARNGSVGPDTRAAFRNMSALQWTAGAERGAWPWLNLGNEPFEAKDSVFYGAVLAAVAIGTAPDDVRQSPGIQRNLQLLRDYLHREYPRQSLSNQAVLLWGCSKFPDIISTQQRGSIVDSLLSKQRSDGGWNLSSLVWTWEGSNLKRFARLWLRSENTPLLGKSDGYATGLIAYVLEQCGLPRENIHLRRALDWLNRNQSKTDGRWPSYSLNHPHAQPPTGLFMSDAATAYGVLALTSSDR
jgi:squalene-hopene/tetraprenyl-beta-curcumene cyclase